MQTDYRALTLFRLCLYLGEIQCLRREQELRAGDKNPTFPLRAVQGLFLGPDLFRCLSLPEHPHTVSTWKVSKGSLAGADQNIPSSGRNSQLWSRVNRLVFSKINSVSKAKTNLSVGPKSKVEPEDSL